MKALRCGLNGRNTKHWHGIVIRTKQGAETHCGRDCALSFFGIHFDAVQAAAKRAEDRAARVANIAQAIATRDSVLQEALQLHDAVGIGCCAMEGGFRWANEVDRDTREAMGLRSRGVDLITVGVVRGGEAIAGFHTIPRLLRFQVLLPLQELQAAQLERLSDAAIQAKSAELTQMRAVLQAAQVRIYRATLIPEDDLSAGDGRAGVPAF